MTNVLVASLGESPVVVTAMVDALRKHPDPDGPRVAMDQLVLLYPQQGDHLIGAGADLAHDVLRDEIDVEPYPLPFYDVASGNDCIGYLRALDGVLQQHASDDVYVSLAGGRKSMAALTAVITQFHPQVQGLYHLLDRYESFPDRRNFCSIEELFSMSREASLARMRPPVDALQLVSIPYRFLLAPQELRRFLAAPDRASAPVDGLGEEAMSFFEEVFGPDKPDGLLDLHLSATAEKQFRDLDQRRLESADIFWHSFQAMRNPLRLKEHVHAGMAYPVGKRTLHFYKPGHTKQRPCFYTEPSSIYQYPKLVPKRVVVVGLSEELASGQYHPTGEEWVKQASLEPTCGPAALRPQRGVLLASLGESPMVVTQTFTLLCEMDGVEGIDAVALVYPGGNPSICNSAQLLKRLFEGAKFRELRGTPSVPVLDLPVPALKDVDSKDACLQFGAAIDAAIKDLRAKYPDHRLHISLSGGRKGMAALTYFAAQREHVPEVWHTVIPDPEVAKRVEHETAPNAFAPLLPAAKARLLFLAAYPREAFAIFPVPVVPIT